MSGEGKSFKMFQNGHLLVNYSVLGLGQVVVISLKQPHITLD